MVSSQHEPLTDEEIKEAHWISQGIIDDDGYIVASCPMCSDGIVKVPEKNLDILDRKSWGYIYQKFDKVIGQVKCSEYSIENIHQLKVFQRKDGKFLVMPGGGFER